MNKQKTSLLAGNLVEPYPEVSLNVRTTHTLSKDYAALKHKIDVIRDQNVPSSQFRTIVDEITTIMMTEATRGLKLEEYDETTPVSDCVAHRIAGKKMVLVPILRAGMGMEPAAKRLFPNSRTGFCGVYRDDKTLKPVEYFWKMPKDIENRKVYVLDPMLATGGSADYTVGRLKQIGCTDINFVCIIAAPKGVDLMQQHHPDVHLYIGNIDLGLNDKGYIVPGLGDAGDRIFGTK